MVRTERVLATSSVAIVIVVRLSFEFSVNVQIFCGTPSVFFRATPGSVTHAVPMFKLQYLRMRSRYMLFCFMAVFSFSVLFIMFQNSLSRPAIETLVTETHKQITNLKNFKVKKPPRRALPLRLTLPHRHQTATCCFFFSSKLVLKRISGQLEGGGAKGTGGEQGLFDFSGVRAESLRLSERVLEEHLSARGGDVCAGRRT